MALCDPWPGSMYRRVRVSWSLCGGHVRALGWVVPSGAWLRQPALPSRLQRFLSLRAPRSSYRGFLAALTPRTTAEKAPEPLTCALGASSAERCLWAAVGSAAWVSS